MNNTDYLRVRHRDRHDGRNFTVWQTLATPRRYVATWDHPAADNPPATDADYIAATFCGAIDALLNPAAMKCAAEVPPADHRPAAVSFPSATKQLGLFDE